MVDINKIAANVFQVVSFRNETDLALTLKNYKGYTFTTLATTTIADTNKTSRKQNDRIKEIKSALIDYGVKEKTLATDIDDYAVVAELESIGAISHGRVHVPSSITFDDMFKGRTIFKTSTRSGYGFGNYSYESMVNNRRLKEGVTADFKSEAPRGRHFYDGSKVILQSDKDEKQFYIRTYKFNKGCISDSVYHYEDGTPLNDSELDLLVDFLPLESTCEKQGVENEVVVNDFKLEGVMYVKLGSTYICRESYVPRLRYLLKKQNAQIDYGSVRQKVIL